MFYQLKKNVLKWFTWYRIVPLCCYHYSVFRILIELEWLSKLYTCLFCFTKKIWISWHTKVFFFQLSEWWLNNSCISCCLAFEWISVFEKFIDLNIKWSLFIIYWNNENHCKSHKLANLSGMYKHGLNTSILLYFCNIKLLWVAILRVVW